jgi:hypothetical protein
MCCDYDDPPLPNSPHAPIWEARWGMTIEERWAEDDPDPYLDEELKRLVPPEGRNATAPTARAELTGRRGFPRTAAWRR